MCGSNENCIHARIAPKNHITNAVPHDDTPRHINFMKIMLCLVGHTRIWFAVRRIIRKIGAKINFINPAFCLLNMRQHMCVYII